MFLTKSLRFLLEKITTPPVKICNTLFLYLVQVFGTQKKALALFYTW